MTAIKKPHQLTLLDKLSRLTFTEACKLVGPEGRRWIILGASRSISPIR